MIELCKTLLGLGWVYGDWILLGVWAAGALLLTYKSYHGWWREDAESASITFHTTDENELIRRTAEISRVKRPERIKHLLTRVLFWPFVMVWHLVRKAAKAIFYPFLVAADRVHTDAIKTARKSNTPRSDAVPASRMRCGKCEENVLKGESHICDAGRRSNRQAPPEGLTSGKVYCEDCDAYYSPVARKHHEKEYCSDCGHYNEYDDDGEEAYHEHTYCNDCDREHCEERTCN